MSPATAEVCRWTESPPQPTMAAQTARLAGVARETAHRAHAAAQLKKACEQRAAGGYLQPCESREIERQRGQQADGREYARDDAEGDDKAADVQHVPHCCENCGRQRPGARRQGGGTLKAAPAPPAGKQKTRR